MYDHIFVLGNKAISFVLENCVAILILIFILGMIASIDEHNKKQTKKALHRKINDLWYQNQIVCEACLYNGWNERYGGLIAEMENFVEHNPWKWIKVNSVWTDEIHLNQKLNQHFLEHSESIRNEIVGWDELTYICKAPPLWSEIYLKLLKWSIRSKEIRIKKIKHKIKEHYRIYYH